MSRSGCPFGSGKMRGRAPYVQTPTRGIFDRNAGLCDIHTSEQVEDGPVQPL
jgi:hypothetical protein